MTYMAGNYRASRMVLSMSSNIDEAAVLAGAGGQFGGSEKRIERDSEQVHFVLGFADVSIHDDACHSQGVLVQILGGGIASRLFMEIREKRGLSTRYTPRPTAAR
jgi:predicted Zn-dependent peptidase